MICISIDSNFNYEFNEIKIFEFSYHRPRKISTKYDFELRISQHHFYESYRWLTCIIHFEFIFMSWNMIKLRCKKKFHHWWLIFNESKRMTHIELKLGPLRTFKMTHRFESSMLKFFLHRNLIIFHHININSKWIMHVSQRYDS